MPDIEFACSKCGQTMEIEDTAAGMEVECPSCQARITVPVTAPSPKPELTLKSNPTPSQYVPNVPVRETSAPQESGARAVIAKSVKWLSIAVLIALIALAGRWVYRRVDAAQSKTRAHDMIAKLAAQGMWDHEHRNLAPFMAEAGVIAKELAPLLSRNHDVFMEQCMMLTRIDDAYRRTARSDALTGIISQLPPGTDLTSLLYVPSTNAMYGVSFKRVVTEGDVPWLLKQSCRNDARATKFAGDVLASYLPTGIPSSEAELVVRLGERTRLEDKQNLYTRLTAAAEQIINERLLGSYTLQIEAIYRDRDEREELFLVHTEKPCLLIENKNHQWVFTLFGQTKQYPLHDLAEIDLSVEIPKEALVPSERRLANKTAKIVARMPEAKLDVQLSPVTVYEPPQGGGEFGFRTPPKPGFTKFECVLVKSGSEAR